MIISLTGLLLTNCSSKEAEVPKKKIIHAKITQVNIANDIDNIVIDPLLEEDEKVFEESQVAKVWVATYKSKSKPELRVRSHFTDIWIKRARFKDLEYSPDYLK